MQKRKFLFCIMATLVILMMTSHKATAQGMWNAKITQLNAPSTVVAGQPLTVTVTASYTINPAAGQDLLIAILDHTENGNPFPTTANSCDPTGMESLCFAHTTQIQGFFTATFILTAPNQAETWNLCVFADVVELNFPPPPYYNVVSYNFKIVPVVVTSTVPEFPITELPILIICMTLVSIMVRKFVKAETRQGLLTRQT